MSAFYAVLIGGGLVTGFAVAEIVSRLFPPEQNRERRETARAEIRELAGADRVVVDGDREFDVVGAGLDGRAPSLALEDADGNRYLLVVRRDGSLALRLDTPWLYAGDVQVGRLTPV